MFYAWNEDKTDATLAPGARGICPQCGSPVLAKCGELNTWHWAHQATQNCDSWSEPEGPWHKAWKELFPREWREVVVSRSGTTSPGTVVEFTGTPPFGHKNGVYVIAENDRGYLVLESPGTVKRITIPANRTNLNSLPSIIAHRADVKTDRGIVVEFQNSPIDPTDILSRELFYNKMVWVFNATGWASRVEIPFPDEKHCILLSELTDTKNYTNLINLLSARDDLKAKYVEYMEKPRIHPLDVLDGIGSREQRFYFSKDNPLQVRSIKFKWKNPKTTLFTCRKTMFWDFGSPFLLLFFPLRGGKIQTAAFPVLDQSGGYIDGYLVRKADVLRSLLGGTPTTAP